MFPLIQRQLCSQRLRIRVRPFSRCRRRLLHDDTGHKNNKNTLDDRSSSVSSSSITRLQDFLEGLSKKWHGIIPSADAPSAQPRSISPSIDPSSMAPLPASSTSSSSSSSVSSSSASRALLGGTPYPTGQPKHRQKQHRQKQQQPLGSPKKWFAPRQDSSEPGAFPRSHQPSAVPSSGPSSPPPSEHPSSIPRIQEFIEDLSKKWWVIHPDLTPFIRPSISGMDHGDSDIGRLQTDFSVCFLGTGAGVPSALRNSSATALRLNGMSYLFDAGEGVQSQIMLSGMHMSEICKIFITHLHGDHVFGLPGLLLGIQLVAMARNEPAKIKVYGPVGLFNFIAVSLSLSCAELNSLHVEVYELRGGSRRKWVHPGTMQNYPEFKNRGLFRKSIPQNTDGTWTLQQADEITSPEEAEKSSTTNSSNDRGLYVHAAQVSHVPALQCFGYVVQEPLSMPQRVDAERAMAAGVQPGRKYRILKAGFGVTSDDGLRRVHPKDVIVDGQHIISRKFALLGDCCGVPAPMAELCRDADVLVHEATLLQTDEGRKVERGGHSSASMAGVFADYVNAKVVALNHISPKNRENATIIIEEATKAIRGTTTRVQLSYDFLELFVPRTGFPYATTRK